MNEKEKLIAKIRLLYKLHNSTRPKDLDEECGHASRYLILIAQTLPDQRELGITTEDLLGDI